MLLCNDPSKGYFYYYCPECDKDIITHFSCNSRVCSRCGKRYADNWAKQVVKRMYNVGHSHVIFTMPDVLWPLIKDNWKCIKEMSDMTHRVMKEIMERTSKHNLIPGMISSIQTYGKDLKYNVHFHTIVTEGGLCIKEKKWIKVSYYPYDILRLKWKIYSLDIITKHIDKTIDNQIILESVRYHQYRNGFNVRVIKTGIPKKELMSYIARYIRHPAISDRRIVHYDGRTVTIFCEDERKPNKSFVSFTVEEFITRLVQHIPKKNFKLVRYYGLYRRGKKFKKVKPKGQETLVKYIGSRHSINCPFCGKILEPLEYFPPTLPNGPPTRVFGERIVDWIS